MTRPAVVALTIAALTLWAFWIALLTGCAARGPALGTMGAVLAEYRATLELICDAGELPAADCEAHRRHLLALLKGEADAVAALVADAARIEDPIARARLLELATRITVR